MRRTFLALLLLSAPAHATEHDFPAAAHESDAAPRVSLTLSTRSGLVRAPFVTAAFPEVSGFGTVLMGEVAVRVSTLDWLRLRLPWTVARLDFPAGAQVPVTALGNVEVGMQRGVALGNWTRASFGTALIAPSAQHGPEASLLANRALAIADALNGGQDAALLTPGVTGLRVAATIRHRLRAFDLRASLDVPLLVKASSASLPDATPGHSLGLSPTLKVQAAWWVTAWFSASLGAGMVAQPLRVHEPTRQRDRARRLQPFLEPALHAQLGKHVALALAGTVPVGGSLGGDAWSLALSARVDF